ncbi:uncharacterized protein [Mycetomoellerius zeteki]|uniref:uncharacterized protein n=1 Tax=Mycetomoellerius zeteki TaxID=64791 RepID=UPI00084EAABF|nr:PREDICTED: uncharacterized protein LOC108720647 [Trachymyrmex zeteki]
MVASGSLRLLYWNCREALGKKAEVDKMAESYDIIFLAETCAGEDRDFCVHGFDCVRTDANSSGKRGMLVLIRNPITYAIIDLISYLDCSIEALAISLSLNNSHLVLVGAYSHPNLLAPRAALSNLISFVGSYDPAILMGDFNAHHPLWGAVRSNTAGRILGEGIVD